MDKARLAKLMKMTTSENDGEALNALRMANKMLAAEKLDWQDVLMGTAHRAAPPVPGAGRSPAPSTRPAPGFGRAPGSVFREANRRHDASQGQHRGREIDDLIRVLEADTRSSEADRLFLRSVVFWYRANGYVTHAQREQLQRQAAVVAGRKPGR